MRTVIETPTFHKQAMTLWNEYEYLAFIDWIATHPNAGDVIPGTNGARKVRWSRSGSSKRSGVRVIYYHLVADETVILIMVYAKSIRSNVGPTDIKPK